MGFPPANAIPITNEDGEYIGYDLPETADMYYHDECGTSHPDGRCPNDWWPEDVSAEDDSDIVEEYDPGPEVDDEGGMSDHRYDFGPSERDGWS